MEYEVKVWTKFRGSESLVYKPFEEITGRIDTLEKAEAYADNLMNVLEEFEPTRYEIVEKKVVKVKLIEKSSGC